MEFVPFLFCESVIAALGDPHSLLKPFASQAWQREIDLNVQFRSYVGINVGYEHGTWSYELTIMGRPSALTFEVLQKANTKFLRISEINIMSSRQAISVPFEKILQIVQFSVPYVSMSLLALHWIDNLPGRTAHQLLSSYRHSPIMFLRTLGSFESLRDIMKGFLESDTLKVIHIRSCNFETEIQDFALSKMFKSSYTYSCFSLSFFEKLFAATGSGYFESECDFKFRHLRDFRIDLQTCFSASMVEWKREDGVVVRAKSIVKNRRISMEFSSATAQ